MNSTDKMNERYSCFEAKLESVAKTSLDKHEESMEVISTCDEKIIDHLIKRNLTLMKSLDKVADSVTNSAEGIGASQQALCTSVIQVSENITAMTKHVAALGRNHIKLQTVMDRADDVVSPLVGNMEKLSMAQSIIIEQHLGVKNRTG